MIPDVQSGPALLTVTTVYLLTNTSPVPTAERRRRDLCPPDRTDHEMSWPTPVADPQLPFRRPAGRHRPRARPGETWIFTCLTGPSAAGHLREPARDHRPKHGRWKGLAGATLGRSHRQ